MKWNKWWTSGLTLIVVAGSIGGYFWWSNKATKPLQAALQTTQVRKGNLAVQISATGNIQAANRATLSSSSSGTIAAVKSKQGDKVKKGQVLATFEQNDNTSTANQIASKQLDLKKKLLDLDTLQTQYKEAAEDGRNQLSINIQKQQLDIETTRLDIQTLQEEKGNLLDPIVAPIDGTLVTFSIIEGDTTGGQAGKTSALGEVVDYGRLQMVVGVDELDISKVKSGQQAAILVEALPDKTFVGNVTAIAQEGTASNGVSTFDVTISMNAIDGLKAGMSAEASILTEQKQDALYLPIEAVQSFNNRYFVLVPSTNAAQTGNTGGQVQNRRQQGGRNQQQAGQSQQGQAGQRQGAGAQTGNSTRQNRQSALLQQSGVTRVSVQVGIHNEDFIEIVSGVKEGESVVIPTTAGNSSPTQSGNAGIPGIGIGGGGGFLGGGGGRFSGGNGGGNRTQGQGGGGQGGRSGG